MNFLAHLHLSDGTPGSMLGGILADFVKGPDVAALPPDVIAGVMLHRHIDAFTDRHPVVQRSVSRVSAKLGWFAGIVIDVYYDHILAREWERYCAEPLRSFADRVYGVLEDRFALVPPEASVFVRRFIDTDRLLQYATPAGIADTLLRLSGRIMERMPKRVVRLQDSMPDLIAADADLAADFHAFYPELIASSDEWKASSA
ncbi:MAG TPA: ACP phosphodiesterase [Gemmataceae bacterium]|nr:ACP phosphodiesterase [Gemmataceae bacterium]